MSIEQTGGPAFPVKASEAGYGQYDSDGVTVQHTGLTLRDYFAAKAMQAAATNPAGADGFTFAERAAWAYQQADAMIAERAK